MSSRRFGGKQDAPRVPLLAVVFACLSAACVYEPARGTVNALDVCLGSADGALCDDNQPCTANDICASGRCVGTPVADGTPCTDGNDCTAGDRCTAAICIGTPVADGTRCDDGDPCTASDVCRLARCQSGAPTVCDDGDSCTVDMCMPGVGCVFSARDCGPSVDAAVDSAFEAGLDVLSDAPPVDVADADIDMADARTEVGEPDGEAPDGPQATDAQPDQDAEHDAGADGDARPDAAADEDAGPSEVPDAAGDLVETPPDLRARGGGCDCAMARPRVAPGLFATTALSLAMTLALARRKRRQRGQEPCAGAHRR